jgi:serine/threonine protein kinase
MDRWQQIEKICQSALELDESRRKTFLEQACAGDEALRREVESLLKFDSRGDRFMEEQALEVAAKMVVQEKPESLIGQQLGSYQILALLGAGGMGVVYKARDTRLNRTVAIKVLPSNKVSEPERKRRFIQEARAASALNHPNIVTLHDVGSQSGIDFIVMEYVAGKTLDQRIPRKGMPLKQALSIAIQMADALAAAHRAGLVHRDLKPGNVMVTKDGQVKVLDFGLAKLAERSTPSGVDSAETLQSGTRSLTEEGMILGTVAYMSPEQAEGKKLDARSDIFSFGAVLYEMVTGQRAFTRESNLAILTAILREEPKSVSQIVTGLPREFERILNRCLRKERERRWQTMADVKTSLQELKEELDSGLLASVPKPPKGSRRRLIWLALALALLAAVGVAVWLSRSTRVADAPLMAVPLTSYPGEERQPTFSPDGNQVAFSWNGEKQDNFDIYVKLIGSGLPLRLTTSPAEDFSPAWSPDGRWIAFLRNLPGGRAAVLLISPIGGTERKVAETASPSFAGDLVLPGPFLAWSSDGSSVVTLDRNSAYEPFSLFLLSIETGEKRRFTSPPVGNGDSSPAFSPDGHTLAFSRWVATATSDLYLLSLSDGLKPTGGKRLTFDNRATFSPAWTPDGQEIIFASSVFGRGGLWLSSSG